MRFRITIILTLMICSICGAQNDSSRLDSCVELRRCYVNYLFVDSPPIYSGTFLTYMQNNLEWNDKFHECQTGTVLLEVFFDSMGRVDDVRVSEGLCNIHDQAAIKLLRKSGAWNPALVNGLAVPCCYSVPVFFIPSVLNDGINEK